VKVVGRRGENFGAEKRWKKYIYVGREDGIFVHPQNSFNGLILNWCIGGCWFTPAGGRARSGWENNAYKKKGWTVLHIG
jgi:hypothetical protein